MSEKQRVEFTPPLKRGGFSSTKLMKTEERQKPEKELCIILTRAERDALLKVSGLKKIGHIEVYDTVSNEDGGNYEEFRVIVEG